MNIPRATYRIQLHKGFGFRDATALVPYLAALGISHVYCSPYLRARSGSTHGYDIIAHGELNPEIGSRADFGRRRVSASRWTVPVPEICRDAAAPTFTHAATARRTSPTQAARDLPISAIASRRAPV